MQLLIDKIIRKKKNILLTRHDFYISMKPSENVLSSSTSDIK